MERDERDPVLLRLIAEVEMELHEDPPPSAELLEYVLSSLRRERSFRQQAEAADKATIVAAAAARKQAPKPTAPEINARRAAQIAFLAHASRGPTRRRTRRSLPHLPAPRR